VTSLRAAAAVLLLALTACGEDDHGHTFDNLPDCVADHIELGEAESIAHCLYDFPDLHPEFADVDECVAWVDDEGYPESSEAACEDYFEEMGA
jgi:hypothetical protein